MIVDTVLMGLALLVNGVISDQEFLVQNKAFNFQRAIGPAA